MGGVSVGRLQWGLEVTWALLDVGKGQLDVQHKKKNTNHGVIEGEDNKGDGGEEWEDDKEGEGCWVEVAPLRPAAPPLQNDATSFFNYTSLGGLERTLRNPFGYILLLTYKANSPAVFGAPHLLARQCQPSRGVRSGLVGDERAEDEHDAVLMRIQAMTVLTLVGDGQHALLNGGRCKMDHIRPIPLGPDIKLRQFLLGHHVTSSPDA
ncbi:unnamed protein product [Pleuronectes platessa]|uniref:Uncharacterized protein n=1 Tax=Pleuronectes platessa TaxID=8262 RepID=A0A9N7Z0Q3_PLEPL|nr:unnamed protein product [Pleuronectes platessa]